MSFFLSLFAVLVLSSFLSRRRQRVVLIVWIFGGLMAVRLRRDGSVFEQLKT